MVEEKLGDFIEMSERRYALIVANYEFEDKRLQNLTSPAKDAELLVELLKNYEIGNYDEINLQINKSDDFLRKEINAFFSGKLPDDTLLFYYSGHGVLDNRGRLFLATKNTNMELLRSTALPASFVVEEMDESRSKRQVWIVDCCYSGSAIQGVKSAIGTKVSTGVLEGNGYGRVILSATDSLQLAWEGNQVLGNTPESLFTHYLVEGIKTGDANPFKESISVDDVYNYIHRKIVPHQNPLKSSSKQEGEIIIARNPKPRIRSYASREAIPTGKQEFIGNSSIFGIDFGTTKSAISIIHDGKPVIIRNERGEKFTPSVVTFMGIGTERYAIGTPAIVQAFSNPNGAFFNIKRQIDQETELELNGQKTTYTSIASKIFESLKNIAQRYCIDNEYKAVLCVPAYFNKKQTAAIAEAATKAGFEILYMLTEPVAAALAHGVEKNDMIAVCDLGGGTFDVSILDIGNGVAQVRSVSGDSVLGGIDFDNKIVEFLRSNFFDTHGIDLSMDKVANLRLSDAAEQAKIALSELEATTVFVPNIYADKNGVKNINVLLSREYFEQITKDFIDRIGKCCRQALDNAGTPLIDKIILVGLSTQIPTIKKRVQEIFNAPIDSYTDPNDAVAIGAAIQAGVYSGNVKDTLLLDVIPLSLNVETLGGISTEMLERDTTIPTRRTQIFTTTNDGQTIATIHILQGERPMALDNLSLGSFSLDGIPPAPSGVQQIEITFDVEARGELRVTATEKSTQKVEKFTITDLKGITRSSDHTTNPLNVERTQIKIYERNDNK